MSQLGVRLGLAVALGVGVLVTGVGGGGALAREAPRETPKDSVLGFLEAARDGDYEGAAEFLDLRSVARGERAEIGPRRARKLKVVLDRELWVDVDELSEAPEGHADDGLPPDDDLVGEIASSEGPVPIVVRRRDGEWRFAPRVVSRIPVLYAEFGYGPLGEYIPAPLFELRVFELELWQWVGLLLAVVFAYAAAGTLSWILTRAVGRLTRGTDTEIDDKLLRAAATPLTWTLALGLFYPVTLPLALSVPARETIAGGSRGLIVVTVAWLAMRVIDVTSELMRERWLAAGNTAATGLLPVGRRLVKIFLLAIALLSLLDNLGYDVTGLIAGLGIGGLAVALAAQKSFENFFGSMELSVDRPVAVGDFCRFGGQIGTVEDIGLRSVRVRTLDRTVVTIPNSQFASMELENFAKRDRILFRTVLGLRYETTADQLRFVLAELRKVLLAHERVSPDPARVRFVSYGAFSLDLEIFAFVETSDWNEFLAIREELLLEIMDAVEASGSGFAFPSQTLYVGSDDGLDEARSRAAEAEVRAWREHGELAAAGDR